MALEEVTNIPIGIIAEAGKIALYLQAVGVLAAILIIFSIINLILNFKKNKRLSRIEKKLNLLSKNKVAKK